MRASHVNRAIRLCLWCRGRESNTLNNTEQIGTNTNIPKVFSVLGFARSARSARAALRCDLVVTGFQDS
jgi:hypothetical protein